MMVLVSFSSFIWMFLGRLLFSSLKTFNVFFFFICENSMFLTLSW